MIGNNAKYWDTYAQYKYIHQFKIYKFEKAADGRHIEDNVKDITKRVKVEAPNFNGKKYFDFFLDWLNLRKKYFN